MASPSYLQGLQTNTSMETTNPGYTAYADVIMKSSAKIPTNVGIRFRLLRL